MLRFAAILIGKKSEMLDKEKEFLRSFHTEAEDKTPDGKCMTLCIHSAAICMDYLTMYCYRHATTTQEKKRKRKGGNLSKKPPPQKKKKNRYISKQICYVSP